MKRVENQERVGIHTAPPPRLLSVPEVAVALGIKERHTWKMISRGDLPKVKIGRRTLIDVRDMERLIDRLKETSRDN